MGFIQNWKQRRALKKELRQLLQREQEKQRRWLALTRPEAEALSDEDLWDCVTSRLPDLEEPEGLAALCGPVRTVYTLYWYDLEVQNGGLCQYFVNSSRITAPYLPEALTAVGAEEYRKDFETFVRRNALDVTDLSSFQIQDVDQFAAQNARYPFDAFDEEYYERCESGLLEDLGVAYVRKHLDAFFEE